MDELKKAKLLQFLKDEQMVQTIYGIILEQFLKPTDIRADVMTIAASKIAIDNFKEGWKTLLANKQTQSIKKEQTQVGL